MSAPKAEVSSLLIVFDVDYTLYDCNSDIVVPEALGRGQEHRQLMAVDRAQRMQWTNMISHLLAPFSEDEIRAAVRRSVKVHPGVKKTIQMLAELQRQPRSAHTPHFEVAIVSDSNSLFIDEGFAEHFPELRVDHMHTNPYRNLDKAAAEGDKKEDPQQQRSRVEWYEPAGHLCSLCTAKPNMCKSVALRRAIKKSSLKDITIIYVGDGENDYCLVRNELRLRDYCFARIGGVGIDGGFGQLLHLCCFHVVHAEL